jgi:hypothetical protein
MDATRDHYNDLLEQKREFAEVPIQGIASNRLGGEGRRHIQPTENMVNAGVSAADPRGIQSMRPQGEGRKYLFQPDHVQEQKRELVEAMERGVPPNMRRPKLGPESIRYGGQDMSRILTPEDRSNPLNRDPVNEQPIGGDRRRHINPENHMINNGTADAVESTIGHGRRHVDTFAGQTKFGGEHRYRSTWKQDPSGLKGTSLII